MLSANPNTHRGITRDWHLRYRFKETRMRHKISDKDLVDHIGRLEREVDRLNSLLAERKDALASLQSLGTRIDNLSREYVDVLQVLEKARISLAYLTVMEKSVYEMVKTSRGLPNKVIADKLGISRSCLNFHLNHIFTKMGVRGKNEL